MATAAQSLSVMSPDGGLSRYLTEIRKFPMLARDEEFIKKLLLEIKKKKLVEEIKKNSEGTTYLKRSRWKLSDKAYLAYKQHQNSI